MSRVLILLSYLTLLLMGTAGLGLWVPSASVPAGIAVTAFCVPLMLPLIGVFRGRVRSMQWLGLLSFGYFAVGVDIAFNRLGADRHFGLIVVIASVVLCISIMVHLRKHHRQKPQTD